MKHRDMNREGVFFLLKLLLFLCLLFGNRATISPTPKEEKEDTTSHDQTRLGMTRHD